jgi:hypothetical protein
LAACGVAVRATMAFTTGEVARHGAVAEVGDAREATGWGAGWETRERPRERAGGNAGPRSRAFGGESEGGAYHHL